MPIHEYCDEDRKNCTEAIFLVGDEIPEEIEGRRRVVSVPVIKFRGPFSGGSTSRDVIREVRGDLRVVEAGMDKDVERAKQARYDKQDKERKEFIAEELSTFDL